MSLEVQKFWKICKKSVKIKKKYFYKDVLDITIITNHNKTVTCSQIKH